MGFYDTRIRPADRTGGVSDGGSIEFFKSTRDATNRFTYINAVTRSTPLFAEYDYLDGKILLRVSIVLTQKQAAQHVAALKRALG